MKCSECVWCECEEMGVGFKDDYESFRRIKNSVRE